MSLSRRKFTKEFKEAAVRRLELGASVAEVARACEVNPNLLHRWRRKLREYAVKAFPGEGRSRSEESRIAELERKVGRQAMEIDFLWRCLRPTHGIEPPLAAPGLVHHSDRGVQYASKDYTDLPKEHRIAISMSRKGNPYDNATCESFMKTLKYEEVYRQEYRDLAEALASNGGFVERVYNERRLHSALGYRSPAEFERMLAIPATRVCGHTFPT